MLDGGDLGLDPAELFRQRLDQLVDRLPLLVELGDRLLVSALEPFACKMEELLGVGPQRLRREAFELAHHLGLLVLQQGEFVLCRGVDMIKLGRESNPVGLRVPQPLVGQQPLFGDGVAIIPESVAFCPCRVTLDDGLREPLADQKRADSCADYRGDGDDKQVRSVHGHHCGG